MNNFSAEDTPDANHVENDVASVSIKEEVVDDEVQFIRFWSQGDRETEEKLEVSEARVGSLEVEVSKGLENLDALKAAKRALTAKCAVLKKEHKELKRVALGCEIRLEDGDKRYAQLVDSLKQPGNHPLLRMKREASLVKAKADCKQFSGDLSVIKVVIGEKEEQFKKLDAVNKKLYVAQKVEDSLAVNDVKSLLKVPKVSFDRFTDQTNAGLAKVFCLSKVTEGKA